MTDLTVFNDANCILKINGSDATSSTTINQGDSLEVVAMPNYAFTQLEVSFYDWSVGGVYTTETLTLNSDNTSGTITAPAGEADLTWDITTEQTAAPLSVEVTEAMLDAFYDNSARLLINDVEASVGDFMEEGDTLKGVANEGYVFTSPIIYSFFSNDGGVYHEYPFTMAEDDLSGELTFANDSVNWDGFEYAFQVLTEQEAVAIASNNKVYIVTHDDLEDLSVQRFVRRTDDVVVDYGQYILGLVELPFELPEEFVGGNESVELGPHITTVTGTGVSTDNLPYDLGEISVPLESDSMLDFTGLTCVLHLPNTGPINIDPQYVIGETIYIQYLFNLYDGTATINISSTKTNGETFVSKSTTLGVTVPYSAVTDSVTISNSNVDVGGFNEIITPYLEIIKFEAMNVDGKYTIPIIDEDILGNHSGYVQVENVSLSFGANKDEKDLITTLLNSGVTINE